MKLTESFIKELVSEVLQEGKEGFKPVQRKVNELKAELDKYVKENPDQKEAAKGRIKRMLGLE